MLNVTCHYNKPNFWDVAVFRMKWLLLPITNMT